MPYRRLPNTDKARIRAMQKALNGFDTVKNGFSVLSDEMVIDLKQNILEFTKKVDAYNYAFSSQKENKKKYKHFFYNCKLYVSHFIQVMNFAVLRGEFDKKTRKFYQLKQNSSNLPALNSEKQLVLWGEIIINGEVKRISDGGEPIENPSLSSLKNSYEKFIFSIDVQKKLQDKTNSAQSDLVEIRPQIDVLIKELWDEIEASFEKYPPLVRREKSKNFGIIFIYRKNEEKIELADLLKL